MKKSKVLPFFLAVFFWWVFFYSFPLTRAKILIVKQRASSQPIRNFKGYFYTTQNDLGKDEYKWSESEKLSWKLILLGRNIRICRAGISIFLYFIPGSPLGARGRFPPGVL